MAVISYDEFQTSIISEGIFSHGAYLQLTNSIWKQWRTDNVVVECSLLCGKPFQDKQ